MTVASSSSFEDKVVWITGASSGIGEALAYRFNEQRARLILSSNEEGPLARVADACKETNENVAALFLDLSQVDAMESKAREVLERFGCVDILVNNGGISQRSLVKDTSLDVVRKIMDIDFLGHVALTLAVLPSMLKRKSGHIVVTSSLAGKIGVPFRSGYCAAKHALHGFFDTLRAETWQENIRVTLVCPAAVKTDISYRALEGDGSRHGKMDDLMAGGISADLCADKILRAIEKEKEEIVIGGRERYAVLVSRLFPRIFSRIIRKVELT